VVNFLVAMVAGLLLLACSDSPDTRVAADSGGADGDAEGTGLHPSSDAGDDGDTADGSMLQDAASPADSSLDVDSALGPDAAASFDASSPTDGGSDGAAPAASCDDQPSDGCLPSCGNLPDDYVAVVSPAADPPYAGTVWFSTEIITDQDPSAFSGLTHTGTGSRVMFDRRTGAFETYDAHLFDARFGTAVVVEIQVNPEFTLQEAQDTATEYASVIGRLPAFLFAELDTVWIHRGMEPFGGGNNNLLIHTEQAATYINDGVLEETFLHEATHTSLDADHSDHPNWVAAQQADGVAISTYARDNLLREDLAESIGPYLAVRFRASRLTPQLIDSITSSLPNRLEYLDCLGLSMDLVP